MARLARCEYLDPHAVQIAHITSRCVRRAFLCGEDTVSGQSFEHRRQWIRDRLEFLASVFAIDCLTFAVMSNHLHLILRSRPDIVRSWSDEEVATRWLRLCPPRRNGKPVEPGFSDIAMITNNPRTVAELRNRLSNFSWWMRLTCQKIAQQANREDDCTGRFWEGRYKAQLLLDDAAILACAIYVDLNPIRAAMAQSLEDSHFTGAKARIDDLKDSKLQFNNQRCSTKKQKPKLTNKPKQTARWERCRGRKQCGWLSPLEIQESLDPIGIDASQCGRRASLKGFLTMSIVRYLELLDWTGRQLRSDKRGVIPTHTKPTLQSLGIDPDHWLDLAEKFGSLFKRAAGSSIALSAQAELRDQNWFQAPGKHCFN